VRHPGDHDTLAALISFSRDGSDAAAALEYALRLAQLMPGDQSLARLINDLQQRNKGANGRK
jgi:hypothetical protein